MCILTILTIETEDNHESEIPAFNGTPVRQRQIFRWRGKKQHCCVLHGRSHVRVEWIGIWFQAVNQWILPIPSMYGIFTYIYHTNQPNVGKYTIHGSYGLQIFMPLHVEVADLLHVFFCFHFPRYSLWTSRLNPNYPKPVPESIFVGRNWL